jgi:hypothetical protein
MKQQKGFNSYISLAFFYRWSFISENDIIPYHPNGPTPENEKVQ